MTGPAKRSHRKGGVCPPHYFYIDSQNYGKCIRPGCTVERDFAVLLEKDINGRRVKRKESARIAHCPWRKVKDRLPACEHEAGNGICPHHANENLWRCWIQESEIRGP